MDGFTYKRGTLFCENVSVAALAAKYGTPLYIYSQSALLGRLRELQRAFRKSDPLICYSVKANANLSVIKLLSKAGSGFDIVSGGELFRVLQAGADPAKIVFAGVGKTPAEIDAAIKAGICMFNAESESELTAINASARRMRTKARVALRLNPNVDARTHAKTTTGKKENKFGIDMDNARRIFAERARFPHLEISGIHLHLGSPIYTVDPYRKALKKAAAFIKDVQAYGAVIRSINIGGGYCISYDGREVIQPAEYAKVIVPAVQQLGLQLLIEPGRFIAGNSAILLSRVTYVKEGWNGRKFAILDAGMSDLIRPAFYDSYHHIWPVSGGASPMLNPGSNGSSVELEKIDVVGPICETSDCFARGRELPRLQADDLVALFSAGAYGMAMSSNYNSRPRPAEVLVDRKNVRVIRKRETYEDLIRLE